VTVVSDLVILMGEGTVTIDAVGSRPMLPPVDVGHGRERKLFREDLVNSFAFRHYMFVKTRHDILAAIDCGRRLVFRQICEYVTAKPAHRVFVHDVSSCIRLGVLGRGYEKGFKVAD